MSRPGVELCILSTADWDRPIWTNKQHLAARLENDYPVTYVNSTGLRWPRPTAGDARRIIRRLGQPTSQKRSPRDGRLNVVSPRTLPLSSSRVVARWNAEALRRTAQLWFTSEAHKVLWTFSPATYGLESVADSVVYHSVDLLHEFPGVNAGALLRAERQLAQRPSVVAIASSTVVQAHLVTAGFDAPLLWPNVADVGLYSDAARQVEKTPGRVIFAGNMSDDKVDGSLLTAVVALPEVHELVLAGPVGEGGGSFNGLQRLLSQPKVRYLGVLGPAELARALAGAEVGLIPYHLNPYTAGVHPMKLSEYLAAGCMVVSTPLPSLMGVHQDAVRLVEKHSFADAVASALRAFVPPVGDNLASWDDRAQQARALISVLARRSDRP